MRYSYNITKATHHLQIVDVRETTFRSSHVFHITANYPFRFFERQYFWSGKGSLVEAEPRIISEVDRWGQPKQKIHGDVIAESTRRILLVDLGKTLQKGEHERLEFKHEMKDLENTFNHCLGIRPDINSPQRVELSVSLPLELAKNVVFDTYDLESGDSFDVERILPETNEEGYLLFKKPEFSPDINKAYRIRWHSN